MSRVAGRYGLAVALAMVALTMLAAPLGADTGLDPPARAKPLGIDAAAAAAVPASVAALDFDGADAAPGVTFGRGLDLEGTPIRLAAPRPGRGGAGIGGISSTRAAMGVPAGSPVRFHAISSGFGSRWHPVYGGARFHAGVDMTAPYGTPVVATAPGIIATAGSCGGYGLCVAIDHGGGVATVYGHLSRVDVAPGAPVGRGQPVGLVGSTGVSTGPHLHYEVRRNGQPLNPVPYL